MKKNKTYDMLYFLTSLRRSPSGDDVINNLLKNINYLDYLIYVKEVYK